MHEINLLPKLRNEFDRSKKILKTLRILSISSLVIVVVLSLVLFFLNIRSPLPALKKEENDLISALLKIKDKIEKHVIVQDRLQNVDPILKNRKDLESVITFFTEKAPPGVSIQSFAITTESVALQVSATSVFVINQFNDELVKAAKSNSVVNKITMDNFVAQESGDPYTFSLKTQLVKKN